MFVSTKPSILIIDDDRTILRVFSRIFQRNGYCVTVAEKGKEALEKLSIDIFDVALIDFTLPDMEGVELFPLIEHKSPRTLKIILTGKTDVQGSIMGADAFFGKPVSPNKLLSVIDTKLRERNLET